MLDDDTVARVVWHAVFRCHTLVIRAPGVLRLLEQFPLAVEQRQSSGHTARRQRLIGERASTSTGIIITVCCCIVGVITARRCCGRSAIGSRDCRLPLRRACGQHNMTRTARPHGAVSSTTPTHILSQYPCTVTDSAVQCPQRAVGMTYLLAALRCLVAALLPQPLSPGLVPRPWLAHAPLLRRHGA